LRKQEGHFRCEKDCIFKAKTHLERALQEVSKSILTLRKCYFGNTRIKGDGKTNGIFQTKKRFALVKGAIGK
jgi:hypothetical protein